MYNEIKIWKSLVNYREIHRFIDASTTELRSFDRSKRNHRNDQIDQTKIYDSYVLLLISSTLLLLQREIFNTLSHPKTTVINLPRKPLIFFFLFFSGNDFAGIWHPPTRGYHVRCVYFGDFYDGVLRVPSVLGNLVMTFGSLRKKGRTRIASARIDEASEKLQSLFSLTRVRDNVGRRAYRYIRYMLSFIVGLNLIIS